MNPLGILRGLHRCAHLEKHCAHLEKHCANLENHLLNLQVDHDLLKKHVYQIEQRETEALFYKAFNVCGLWGDYIEFGVFNGTSLRKAYRAAKLIKDSFAAGNWDFAVSADDKTSIIESFSRMRFIGFDSFAGMPKPEGVDSLHEVFREGTYCAARELAEKNILEEAPAEQLVLVEGFFDRTCTPETAQRLGIQAASIIHIDSDLYSSAVTALDFCTPFLREGTVIIFDEYFQFHGSPYLGEQRAFTEWRACHPEWLVQELGRESFGRIGFVLNRAEDPVAAGKTKLD